MDPVPIPRCLVERLLELKVAKAVSVPWFHDNLERVITDGWLMVTKDLSNGQTEVSFYERIPRAESP